jgi:hypothetical protein
MLQAIRHRPDVTSHVSPEETDFSLVLGGPLYQLYVRTRLTRPALQLVWRRVIGMSAICWLPLFLLSLIAGHAFGGVSVSFISDIGVHTRFLVALPILVGAELIVHQRIGIIVRQFLERGMITQKERGPFNNLLSSTIRLRNSVLVEVVLLLIVVIAGPLLWRESLTYGVSTWYAVTLAGKTHTTAAGAWYEYVSSSIPRFLTLRWYFRIFLWYRFLWRVRGLPLHLNLFHPDRVAGLGFLVGSVRAFVPVLIAQSVIVAGVIGDRIWHGGQDLTQICPLPVNPPESARHGCPKISVLTMWRCKDRTTKPRCVCECAKAGESTVQCIFSCRVQNLKHPFAIESTLFCENICRQQYEGSTSFLYAHVDALPPKRRAQLL